MATCGYRFVQDPATGELVLSIDICPKLPTTPTTPSLPDVIPSHPYWTPKQTAEYYSNYDNVKKAASNLWNNRDQIEKRRCGDLRNAGYGADSPANKESQQVIWGLAHYEDCIKTGDYSSKFCQCTQSYEIEWYDRFKPQQAFKGEITPSANIARNAEINVNLLAQRDSWKKRTSDTIAAARAAGFALQQKQIGVFTPSPAGPAPPVTPPAPPANNEAGINPSTAFVAGPMTALLLPEVAAATTTAKVTTAALTVGRILLGAAGIVAGIMFPSSIGREDGIATKLRPKSQVAPKTRTATKTQPKMETMASLPQVTVYGRTKSIDYFADRLDDNISLIGIPNTWPTTQTKPSLSQSKTKASQSSSTKLNSYAFPQPIPTMQPRLQPSKRYSTPQPFVPSSTPSFTVPSPIVSTTKPSLDTVSKPGSKVQPEPFSPARSNNCEPCTKVKKESKRTTCWVKLVKEAEDPSRDTTRNWRKIKCR